METKPKTSRPNPARNRKLLTQLKQVGYTKPEIEETLCTLLALTLKELEHVRTSAHSTALEVTIAGAIIENAAKGNLAVLENLLQRLYGKPGGVVQPAFDLPVADDTPLIIEPMLHATPR